MGIFSEIDITLKEVYKNGQREGIRIGSDTLYELMADPLEVRYQKEYDKEELCWIFDIERRGNIKLDTVISRIREQYSADQIVNKLEEVNMEIYEKRKKLKYLYGKNAKEWIREVSHMNSKQIYTIYERMKQRGYV